MAEHDDFLQMREEHILECRQRLDAINQVLDLLLQTPDRIMLLQQVRNFFYDVSRSARRYGFPQVTVISLQGEYDCDVLIRQKAAPSVADIEKWKAFLHAMRLEYDKPPAQETLSQRFFQVLIVDDDAKSATSLAELLRRQDMIVQITQTKEEALAAMANGMVDGIITDILLPDGLGYELVEYIRGMRDGDRPAILMVSVLSGFLDKVEAIRSGADGYFEKPVDWEALLERLHLLLERNRKQQVRILCVEDDPNQALYLDTVLSLAGYQVRVVDEPSEFEEHLASFRPDLVLIDYHFPRFSSQQVARYLRQDDRYAFMPVLLMTEGELNPQNSSGGLAGADAYLHKPVAPGILLTTVAAYVERSRFLRSHLNRDGLTRLLTHTAFIEQANAVIAKKRRKPDIPCALVMIDLDHFKAVNQKHGHPAGDRVLVSLSAFLRKRIRQSDSKARYGGQEFAIIIDDIREEEAVRLLTRLLEEFSLIDHMAPGGAFFRVTFSAGIAMLDARTMDLELWKESARNALKSAKSSGRRSVVASSSLSSA